MSTVVKDLGPVTAYADAVAAGYTGTKEEWQALMASYASVAEEAQEAKEGAEAAQEAAESARDAAIDAKEGAEDAVDGFGAVVTQATNQAVQTVRAEGTTQVGNVSSEGITQVNDVQAKGAEVLESIPEDYTELSKDVSQLKEDLTDAVSDIEKVIANTEETATASKNYSVGDYLIYNNTLYKVTSAIASGATIEAGTNVTATTVDAELKLRDEEIKNTQAKFEKIYPTPEAPLEMWGGSFQNSAYDLTHTKHGNIYRIVGNYTNASYRTYSICEGKLHQLAVGSSLPASSIENYPISGLQGGKQYALNVRFSRYSYEGTTPLFIRIYELASDGTTVSLVFSHDLSGFASQGYGSITFTANEGSRYAVGIYLRKGVYDVEIESSIKFTPAN